MFSMGDEVTSVYSVYFPLSLSYLHPYMVQFECRGLHIHNIQSNKQTSAHCPEYRHLPLNAFPSMDLILSYWANLYSFPHIPSFAKFFFLYVTFIKCPKYARQYASYQKHKGEDNVFAQMISQTIGKCTHPKYIIAVKKWGVSKFSFIS